MEAFGFGSYENARDISVLHIAKAGEENLLLKSEDILPDGYDDHALHLSEHIRFCSRRNSRGRKSARKSKNGSWRISTSISGSQNKTMKR